MDELQIARRNERLALVKALLALVLLTCAMVSWAAGRDDMFVACIFLITFVLP